MKRLLTAAEVAELLAVPTSWVYQEVRAGRLPHVRLGRYCRFDPEKVETWAATHEHGPAGDAHLRERM